ncbi:MAG: hypothetical protein AB1632_05790 [Nitrospirota bacterium]
MMRTKTCNNMLSFICKPLCVAFLLFSLFGIVWLRSGVVTAAYELRNLEEKKMDALKDMKMLLAERAKLMSLEKINASFQGNNRGNSSYAGGGYVFPDRVRVAHIKSGKNAETYKASFDLNRKNN